mmetsp:Transcript_25883/g.73658  ORF Transcript_25883/g.73658 Transcript_25883/m.73658 type:complete len:227 (-) Transcript_25883:467-1147(-)
MVCGPSDRSAKLRCKRSFYPDAIHSMRRESRAPEDGWATHAASGAARAAGAPTCRPVQGHERQRGGHTLRRLRSTFESCDLGLRLSSVATNAHGAKPSMPGVLNRSTDGMQRLCKIPTGAPRPGPSSAVNVQSVACNRCVCQAHVRRRRRSRWNNARRRNRSHHGCLRHGRRGNRAGTSDSHRGGLARCRGRRRGRHPERRHLDRLHMLLHLGAFPERIAEPRLRR